MQRDPYEEALDEFESGNPDRAVLARATVHSAGNPERLKSEYIRIRAKGYRPAARSWAQLSDKEKEQRAEEVFVTVKAAVKWALTIFVVLGVFGLAIAFFAERM